VEGNHKVLTLEKEGFLILDAEGKPGVITTVGLFLGFLREARGLLLQGVHVSGVAE